MSFRTSSWTFSSAAAQKNRLTIPKQSIKVNTDTFLKNPDAEIKKMAQELVTGLNGLNGLM